MNKTQHIETRMNQRGIKKEMIDLALDYGEIDGDRYTLTRKECQNRIAELRQQQKMLEHAHKKGGIIVVMADDTVITAFRANSFSMAKSRHN